MNENYGSLMVIITFVYVIATIFICVFNGKSAKASREQIIASQKQQIQNAGLQLYSMRKEIVNKIAKHQYDEVFWDVSLLFNDTLSDKFQNIAYKAGELKKIENSIEWFEAELGIILSKVQKMTIDSQIIIAKTNKEYDDLKINIKNILDNVSNKGIAYDSIDEYIENLKQADDIRRVVDGNTFILIQELREFIRDSIR